MTKRVSRVERIRQISLALLERDAAERRKRPYLYVKPTDDLLFVQNVAELLGCSVDHVRRIPRRELPAVRSGARLQYLREDVLNYVRRRRDTGIGPKADLTALNRPMPKAGPVQDYDPVADSRRQLGGKPKR